jgi:hypothetical protein
MGSIWYNGRINNFDMGYPVLLKSFGIALFLLAQIFALSAWAGRKSDHAFVSLSTQMMTYSDLKTSDTTVSEELASSLELELDLRMRGPFQLAFVGSRAIDNLRQAYGIGLRVDLPGFFMLGGSKGKNRSSRNYPVNTSIFGHLLQTTLLPEDEATGVKQMAFSTNTGLSIDVFLFNPKAFLTGQFSIYNFKGNAYMTYGGGLGVEF